MDVRKRPRGEGQRRDGRAHGWSVVETGQNIRPEAGLRGALSISAWTRLIQTRLLAEPLAIFAHKVP